MPREAMEVRDVRGNKHGLYVTLNVATKGTLGTTATVTVKRTQYGTHVCFTCLTIDCKHARYVEGGLNDGSIQEEHAA